MVRFLELYIFYTCILLYKVQASLSHRANALGPFLTSPLSPRGEICSIGGMFTPSFSPRGEHRISPPGNNFALGVKVCPRGEVKNGTLLSALVE
jgi:hypothetical protein